MKGCDNVLTADDLFYKEFTQMMGRLRSANGYMDLKDIPLPPGSDKKFFVETRKKVIIGRITEEYYSKLSGTEAQLWGSTTMRRRKYDYKGEFMKDKNDNYILIDEPCPHGAVGIVSNVKIEVPTRFKSRESFKYIDYIEKDFGNGKKGYKYAYIIPRQYCYSLNMSALVFSWNKMRKYYWGVSVALQNGHKLFIYVIPYKPSSVEHNYRIIHTKTSIDYTEEISAIYKYWLEHQIVFDSEQCYVYDLSKDRGIDNMAYQIQDGVLDDFIRFDPNKPLNDQEELNDVDFAQEDT